MRIAERTLADLPHLLQKVRRQKKQPADFALVRAPEKRRLPLLTAIRTDPSA